MYHSSKPTTWNSVFLQKLTVSELVKNIPCVLWNTALYYNLSPMALVLIQTNPVRVVPLVHLPAVQLQVTVSARVRREVSL